MKKMEIEVKELIRRFGGKSWENSCANCGNIIKIVSQSETSMETVASIKETCETYAECHERDSERYNYELKEDEQQLSSYCWDNYCFCCDNVIEIIWQSDRDWETVARVKKPCNSYKDCEYKDCEEKS